MNGSNVLCLAVLASRGPLNRKLSGRALLELPIKLTIREALLHEEGREKEG
jgi:hypothetical protein